MINRNFSSFCSGNSVQGKCSLNDIYGVMSLAKSTVVMSRVKDSFGFPVQYGSDYSLTYHGIVGTMLNSENGMTIMFKLYIALLNDDVLLLSFLLKSRTWLNFGVASTNKFFLKYVIFFSISDLHLFLSLWLCLFQSCFRRLIIMICLFRVSLLRI